MIKVRNIAALLAIAALPACSMFGGDNSRSSRAGAANASLAAPTPPPAPAAAVQTPVTPELIRSVQEALRRDGKYHGRVDGVWGPRTQAAVRDYQQQHNIATTGQLDQDTLTAMNLAGSNPAPSDTQRNANYNPGPGTAAPAGSVNTPGTVNPAPANVNPPPGNVNPPPGPTTR